MTTPKIISEFRGGLAKGELLLQKCNACGTLNMYPRYACPACQSEDLGWQKSRGRGKLHSFCVLRQGAPEGFEGDLPYAIGVVKLEEGVQMLARLAPEADGDWKSYQCDDWVDFVAVEAAEIERRPCATFRRASS